MTLIDEEHGRVALARLRIQPEPEIRRLSTRGDGSREAGRLVAAAEGDRCAAIGRLEQVLPGSGFAASATEVGNETFRLLRTAIPDGELGDSCRTLDLLARSGDLRLPRAGVAAAGDSVTHDLPAEAVGQRSGIATLRLLEPYAVLPVLDADTTLVFNQVEPQLDGLARGIAEDLATALRCHVQVNAYISRGLSPGFGRHWDDHDVMILQLDGRKYWEVHALVEVGPVRALTSDESCGEVVWSGILEPGYALLIPRGWAHSVKGFTAELSVHLTYGLTRPKLHDLLGRVDPSRFDEVVASPTAEDLDQALASWRSTIADPPTEGPLAAAATVDLGFDDIPLRVRMSCGMIFVLDGCTDQELMLLVNGRELVLARPAADALAWLLENPGATGSEFGFSAGLARGERVELLSRLAEAGLIHRLRDR